MWHDWKSSSRCFYSNSHSSSEQTWTLFCYQPVKQTANMKIMHLYFLNGFCTHQLALFSIFNSSIIDRRQQTIPQAVVMKSINECRSLLCFSLIAGGIVCMITYDDWEVQTQIVEVCSQWHLRFLEVYFSTRMLLPISSTPFLFKTCAK